ncbi:divalent-cation tolerance protein CutA [Candidatus Woesearchaeota archaeon]|nr:divalent-cation tolerance protein CutA [Candidatus Woesearchaeota archaeon]
MAFAYITCKDKKEARKIAHQLLKKRLIACANIFPIESMYRWKKKKMVDDKEIVIMAKTLKKHYPQIKKIVKKIHSYDIPCVCLLDSTANKEYLAWVKKEV